MQKLDAITYWAMAMSQICVQFANGMIMPTISTYFFSAVGADVVAIANIASTAVACVDMHLLSKNSVLDFLRRHFAALLILDITIYIVVNYYGVDKPFIRFVGVYVESAFTVQFIEGILEDVRNSRLMGRYRTIIENEIHAKETFAYLIGAVLAIVIYKMDMNPDISTCIILFTIFLIVASSFDYLSFKRLQRMPEIGSEAKIN